MSRTVWRLFFKLRTNPIYLVAYWNVLELWLNCNKHFSWLGLQNSGNIQSSRNCIQSWKLSMGIYGNKLEIVCVIYTKCIYLVIYRHKYKHLFCNRLIWTLRKLWDLTICLCIFVSFLTWVFAQYLQINTAFPSTLAGLKCLHTWDRARGIVL